MRDLVVATRNPGKVAELGALLAAAGYRAVSLADVGVPASDAEDGLETGDTFEANARAKALYFAARVGGLPVVADDSGLCVAALGGAPGVRSRRYAGRDVPDAEAADANVARLLAELGGVADRRAEFVAVLAYAEGGDVRTFEGRTAGVITSAPCGRGGFGYDPVFWSDELGACFGDVTGAEKARVSHRARAAAALVAWLEGRGTRHVAGRTTRDAAPGASS